MLSIYDGATALMALDQPLDPVLRNIINDRLTDAAAIGLADQTHIIVIQVGDTEAMVVREIGWSPLIDPMSEARYGEPDFQPYWAWFQDLGGWYELLHTVGNSGFAYIFLIEQAAGTVPELLDMCREFGTKGGATSCAC